MTNEQLLKQMLNFISYLSIGINESPEFKNDLYELLKCNDPMEWPETQYINNQIKQWLDIIENNVIYDNDGEFYCWDNDGDE